MPTRILITGVGGFVGSTIAKTLLARHDALEIVGIDNLSRSGSAENVRSLLENGVRFHHGDVRSASDLENMPESQWIIDAAAHPSVLAGVSSRCTARQAVENNLFATANLLELCRRWGAGFILLSSSRVYSIRSLSSLPVAEKDKAFVFDPQAGAEANVEGVSHRGISERFSTTPPLSLYGSTKLASETLALEYGYAFDLPVWINRCGILAGATQFGRPDQGIFAYWLHSWHARLPLRYIGFGGQGFQVRDCLHPCDLAALIGKQILVQRDETIPQVVNVSGGIESARSLAQISAWCRDRWGDRPIDSDPTERQYDLPWIVLDHDSAVRHWDWRPGVTTDEILSEIADAAERNPGWCDLSNLY